MVYCGRGEVLANPAGQAACRREKTAAMNLKFEVPRQRITLIDRPRLVQAMHSMAEASLALLVAPAGFGKSTLLTQWLNALPENGTAFAWITLDEDDGDERQFLAGLLHSLHLCGVAVPAIAARPDAAFAETSPERLLHQLIEALSADPRTIHLVLDDYHRCANPTLDALVLKLVRRLPDRAHLIVSTRQRPHLGVAQLIAAGLARELPADRMRLNRDECALLLGGDLPSHEVDLLAQQTEGWPAVLQLARLVLRDNADLAALLRGVTGGADHISTYLTEQVLSTLPADLFDFLLDTAIFESFSCDLVDTVRETTDSWAMMEALEPLQSLITPIEEDGTWYRYHHLFADYLRATLARRNPERAARLHRRASLAFEARGAFSRAVRHAAQANDFDRCAHLVEQSGGWEMVLYGGANELASALRQIPAPRRLAFPRVVIAEAYIKLKSGDLAAARRMLEQLSPEWENPQDWTALNPIERDIFCVSSILHTYLDDAFSDTVFERFEAVRKSLGPGEALVLGVLGCTQSLGALAIGRLEEAQSLSMRSMLDMRAANSILGLNYSYLHAGMASLYRGDLQTAQAHLSRAREMAEANFGQDSGLRFLADVLWGYLEFWRTGRTDIADADYVAAVEHVRQYDGWFEIHAAGLDTCFACALGRSDLTEMARVVADAQVLLASRPQRRLRMLVGGYRLRLAQCLRADDEARTLAEELGAAMPIGAWRQDLALWRPWQETGSALAWYWRDKDPALAAALAQDLRDCAQHVGAGAFVSRGLPLAEAPVATASSAPAPHAPAPADPSPLPRVEAATVPLALLSTREREVAEKVSLGLTNKEIARKLAMTEHTVKFHLRNIFAKLEVDRRAHVGRIFSARV